MATVVFYPVGIVKNFRSDGDIVVEFAGMNIVRIVCACPIGKSGDVEFFATDALEIDVLSGVLLPFPDEDVVTFEVIDG